ncbi:MAG: HAD-IIA family hydrolase [Oscillospiraceae bacterium]|nr:HAD-IIA family hydrolase [Oscillospiraceae bacterium]
MMHPETIQRMKLFLFDMDGTLYLGDELFGFTIPLLRRIRETGGRYLFMTNNSSKSVEDYIRKLEKLGIHADREDFITSAQATAWYLLQNHPGKPLYVCGTASFKEELTRAGLEVTGDADRAQCIVMGFDTELTFQKLWDVSRLLLTRDIPYIATNPDYVCPTEFGSVPDCGSVCDMIFNATKKRPLVIGKPEALMPQLAMARLGMDAAHTCCIGDRIYTDIRCGLNAGITTILVLSGEATHQTLAESDIKPHFVLQDAGEILDALST